MAADAPNILLIMSDEHAPMYSSTYGHPIVQSPNMDRLAENGVTFENAYCNSPICSPSRMSFMTGQYVHHIGSWDNGSPLPSDTVTWAHLLREVGYDAVLCGKQHFCGLDQLHGFRTQLARDLHAELWTKGGVPRGAAKWSQGIKKPSRPWGGLAEAGPGTTESIEVDDLVQEEALKFLRDPGRKDQPWALNVSFIAPHFPLVVPERFFNLYPEDEIDMPEIPEGHLENQPAAIQRMRESFGLIDDFPEELVRRGRAGYYGLITYLDEKIGQLLDVLEETGQAENTLIMHFSDHGEMNGEHGMWRKSNHYEASARIPMQISWPGVLPSGIRIPGVVSLVDMVATFLEAAGVSDVVPLDGDSLMPLMNGTEDEWKDEAFSEYMAHGVIRPTAMLRRGPFKLSYSLGDPLQLFNVVEDPNEFENLAEKPEYQTIKNELQDSLLAEWDAVELEKEVLKSQKERGIIEVVHHGRTR